MRLAEYSDDELIEEIKHRGLKIECIRAPVNSNRFCVKEPIAVKIGGVVFDLRT